MLGADHSVLNDELLTVIIGVLGSLAALLKVILNQRKAGTAAEHRHDEVLKIAHHAAANGGMTAALRAQLVALETSQALRHELLTIAEHAGLPTSVTLARIADTDAMIASVREAIAEHEKAVNAGKHKEHADS